MNKIINFENIKLLLLEIWAAYLRLFAEEKDQSSYSRYNIGAYTFKNDFCYAAFVISTAFFAVGSTALFGIAISHFPFLLIIIPIIFGFILLSCIVNGYKRFQQIVEEKQREEKDE